MPEATAIIADAVCEFARDGLSLPEAKTRAGALLGVGDVLPGVVEAVPEVRVEARFEDGTRLVIVRNPFGAPVPDATDLEPATNNGPLLTLRNEGQNAIGITSHIHLAEVNPRLRFDRAAAYGHRLDIATGTVVWIPAGEAVDVRLRAISGDRTIIGNTGVVNGSLDDQVIRDRALATLRECGYLDQVDGVDLNSLSDAESAVAGLMGRRP